jgi:hypothetical protein
MEPPSPQPFAHANESDAAPWLRPLLEHIGVPAGTAATISAAEAPTTTGAIRELRSQPAEWNAFLDQLSERHACIRVRWHFGPRGHTAKIA